MKTQDLIKTYLDTSYQDFQLDLSQFVDTFLSVNKQLNLSGHKSAQEVVIKQLWDSLQLDTAINIKQYSYLADIGTGGGFPGLPLAICFPHLKTTLVDATQKKKEALDNFIQQLNIQNAKALWGRAEKLGQIKKLREQFDIVTSKALSEFAVTAEYCLPFVKVGGIYAAYVGPNWRYDNKQEENVLRLLGAEIEKIHSYILPFYEHNRQIVICRKTSSCPKKYPRPIGKPKKSPLSLAI